MVLGGEGGGDGDESLRAFGLPQKKTDGWTDGRRTREGEQRKKSSLQSVKLSNDAGRDGGGQHGAEEAEKFRSIRAFQVCVCVCFWSDSSEKKSFSHSRCCSFDFMCRKKTQRYCSRWFKSPINLCLLELLSLASSSVHQHRVITLLVIYDWAGS